MCRIPRRQENAGSDDDRSMIRGRLSESEVPDVEKSVIEKVVSWLVREKTNLHKNCDWSTDLV